LAAAARVSIERRLTASGFEEGAWARNLFTLYHARLRDSEAAYDSLTTLFRKEAGDSLFTGTRLAPANAYEMDYNTGASAGIAEMLLQSHADYIELLPALPFAWAEGQVQGLCARGSFVVDINWENHKPVESRIHSISGAVCRILVDGSFDVLCEGEPVSTKGLDLSGVEFDTQAGKDYVIRSRGD
jgi:alpha-L-fucosidase 2